MPDERAPLALGASNKRAERALPNPAPSGVGVLQEPLELAKQRVREGVQRGGKLEEGFELDAEHVGEVRVLCRYLGLKSCAWRCADGAGHRGDNLR
jgi:hypothetical protein